MSEADPEVRYTQSRTAVANFSMATDERWADSEGNRQQRTEWHRIVAFGKLGEICGKYLKKGRLVFIEGRIQTREWDDRDGNKRYTTEIVASNMQMLESRNAAMEGGGDEAGAPPQEPMEVGITDDDIPF
ncbi:MAG: single-stranded DNA-binding protein [Acidobacteriota bacterium]